MQVDQRGAAGGVAHPFQQLAGVPPGVGDKEVPGMAQVMEVDAGQASSGERRQPDPAAEITVPQRVSAILVNARASASDGVKLARCELTSGRIISGTTTVRLPASDLGGPNIGGCPRTSVSWRVTRTVPVLVSMSQRHRAASSPHRSPQKQASSIKARYRGPVASARA